MPHPDAFPPSPHPDAFPPSRPDLLRFAGLAACGNTDADRLAAIASALLEGATFAQALRAVREDEATLAEDRGHDGGAWDDLIDSLPRGESAIGRGAREAIEHVFGRDALTR